VDFALKPLPKGRAFFFAIFVSILVLVDFALKLYSATSFNKHHASFNPCFGGFCSKTCRLTSPDA